MTSSLGEHFLVQSTAPDQTALMIILISSYAVYSFFTLSLLDNIPENVKIIRINTNGCKRIKQLPALLARKIKIIITVSLDGLNQVHDYARYPVKWTDFSSNLQYYNQLSKEEKMLNLDTWTTVSVLNIQQLPLIQEYCKDYDISHEFALLEHLNHCAY